MLRFITLQFVVRADGTLLVGVSRYTDDWHETGVRRFTQSDPDYEIWCELAKRYQQNEQVRDFISSEELPAIREQYGARAS